MQSLEVSGAVRLIYRPLGVKGLTDLTNTFNKTNKIVTLLKLPPEFNSVTE